MGFRSHPSPAKTLLDRVAQHLLRKKNAIGTHAESNSPALYRPPSRCLPVCLGWHAHFPQEKMDQRHRDGALTSFTPHRAPENGTKSSGLAYLILLRKRLRELVLTMHKSSPFLESCHESPGQTITVVEGRHGSRGDWSRAGRPCLTARSLVTDGPGHSIDQTAIYSRPTCMTTVACELCAERAACTFRSSLGSQTGSSTKQLNGAIW